MWLALSDPPCETPFSHSHNVSNYLTRSLSRDKRKEVTGTVHMPLGTADTWAPRQREPPVQGQQQNGGSALPIPWEAALSAPCDAHASGPQSRLHPRPRWAWSGSGSLQCSASLRSHFPSFKEKVLGFIPSVRAVLDI